MKKALLALLVLTIPFTIWDSSVQKIEYQHPDSWDRMGLPSPELMARLVWVESNGNPYAVSAKGAMGLCQIMPSLARGMGADPTRLYEPDYNLTVGSRWLARLIQRYGVDGALRAWNCGETHRHLWYTEPVNLFVQRITKNTKEEL